MQGHSRRRRSRKQAVQPQQALFLCYYYQQNSCNKALCPRLHLCKDFLINASFCPGNACKSGYSHDPFDENNSAVIERHGLAGASRGAVLEKLRRHFPRICKDYDKRAKCKAEYCNRLHICLAFLFEMCQDRSCIRSHNFHDYHNSNVLTQFSMEKIKQKHYLLASVLTGNMYQIHRRGEPEAVCLDEPESESEWEPSCEDEEEYDYDYYEPDQEYQNECHTRCQSEDEHEKSFNHISTSLSLKPTLLTSVAKPKTNPVSTSIASIAACSLVDIAHTKALNVEQKETSKVEDIFTTLVKLSDSASLDICNANILRHFSGSSSSPDDLQNVMNWFSEHDSTFRLSGPDDDTYTSKKVHACVRDIKPCINYWSSTGCNDDLCRSFHVCKKWLCGVDHSTLSCKLNHDLASSREKVLVQGTYLEKLSVNELVKVLRNRYPYVCMDNYESCSAGLLHCPNLHVCYGYMIGTCKKREALCDHKHACAFFGIQAARLMKDFHINKEDFEDAILLPKKVISIADVAGPVVETNQDFNFLKEAAICHHHAGSVCTFGGQCALLHTKNNLPYLWQHRDPKGDTWVSLDQDSNVLVESYFCDPVNDTASCNDVHIFFTFDKSKKSFTGTFQHNPVHFRRLSTKSNISATSELGQTEWKWYWKKSKTEWEEYAKWVTSQMMEKSYLADEVFSFTTDEFDYNVSFEKMEQHNLDERYQTKRNIRRRPVFHSSLRTEGTSIPSHWPVNCPQGQRINVVPEKYKNVEQEFMNSMKRHIYVLNVEEICNEEYYEKYEGKKRSLAKKLGEDKVNERFLYHGTDDTTVTKVCAQNFDWRLCGKNGTAYGDGSYFARDASYSHTYSTSSRSQVRYMFLASVLVGQSTKGSGGLKRPPPIRTSEIDLYDSCVDNVINPSIFVIFERDQCYPKYLISYTEDSYCARTYKRPSTTLNPRTAAPVSTAPRPSISTAPPTPTTNATNNSSCVIS